MALTKTEKQHIKEQLSTLFGSVYLECDGYLISVQVRRSGMKLIIEVYVNGWVKGSWFNSYQENSPENLAEEAKRFWCRCKIGNPRNYIQKMEKAMGKKWCQQNNIYEKRIYVKPSIPQSHDF